MQPWEHMMHRRMNSRYWRNRDGLKTEDHFRFNAKITINKGRLKLEWKSLKTKEKRSAILVNCKELEPHLKDPEIVVTYDYKRGAPPFVVRTFEGTDEVLDMINHLMVTRPLFYTNGYIEDDGNSYQIRSVYLSSNFQPNQYIEEPFK